MNTMARIAMGLCGIGIAFISATQLMVGGDYVFLLSMFGGVGIIIFAIKQH